MYKLEKILNTINIPIWIIKDKSIKFTNDIYLKMKEDKYIINYLEYVTVDDNVGYFENIIIGNELFNKLVIPIDDNNTLLGLLIKKEKNNDINMFKLLIDSIPEIIFCKDNDLNYTVINKECENFYKSRGLDSIIGKTDLDFGLDKKFTETCTKHDKIVLETRKPLYIDERVDIPGTNDFLTYQTIKTPIIDEYGNIHGLVGSVRDISKQKRVEEDLRFLSYRDILTGLYNRTYFEEKISEILKQENYQVGIVLGDLNGLKIVNDIFGHLEGDNFIKIAAEVLMSASRENMYVFRWGGDEFVTLIIDASEEDCNNYIDNVNKACQKMSHKNKNISISQGYSILTPENNKIDDVLAEADKMLYTNKNANKKFINRMTLDKIMTYLDEKGVETQEHVNSVVDMAFKVGIAMQLDYKELEKLRLLALIHDIGKCSIDNEILSKKEKLTEEEFLIAQNHTKIGYKLATMIPEISHISKEILHHHERWDGKGYVNGLKGEDIPLLSRIINVVDAFDIMINGTIYKDKISKEDAILELKEHSGKQFDPNIVDTFLKIIECEN